jgi:Fibrinogen beta and gamma chains, C-terminal globular domain
MRARQVFQIVVAVLVGVVIAAAFPALGDVTKSWIHLKNKHIKPFTDARYFKKTDLQTADGAANEPGDPVDWTRLQGIPSEVIDGAVDWANITGIPSDLVDGAVDWANIAGVPAGFSDGTDDEGLAPPPLGDSSARPAQNCKVLHTTRPALPSGIYWLQPSSAPAPFQGYCDMTTSGGGWTLVWSNLRGGELKPGTNLKWDFAINTLPRVSGIFSADLEAFNLYLGLGHWEALATDDLIRYDWANDYRSPVDQSASCTFDFTTDDYVVTFTSCNQLVGAVSPGLFGHHNNKPFSTYDNDNDTHGGGNCADLYGAPWWYTACWSGSISGGGVEEEDWANAAFWVNSVQAPGQDDGSGYGNGWIFVR